VVQVPGLLTHNVVHIGDGHLCNPEASVGNDWMAAKLALVSQKSAIAEAIRYALTRWDGLCRFLEDGRIEIDPNTFERAIRPIALNRKNALFAGFDVGGDPRLAQTQQHRYKDLSRRCLHPPRFSRSIGSMNCSRGTGLRLITSKGPPNSAYGKGAGWNRLL
jgi:hypothetical protein